MTCVSSVTLICARVESSDLDAKDLIAAFDAQLWTTNGEQCSAQFSEIWNDGGRRHPALHFTLAANVNDLDEDRFANYVMTRLWMMPGNVVLIIQRWDRTTREWPPARVWRMANEPR
jgi:hypothetical protein